MDHSPLGRKGSRQPRVIAAWTNGMLLAAERAGLNTKDLLQGAGLSAESLEDRDAQVEFPRHLHMVHQIVRQQPGISTGLRTGMTATPARFGVLGYVLRYAATLRRALADFTRFQRLVTDVTTWTIESGQQCRLTLTVHPLLDGVPSAVEAQLATVVSISRQLTGVHIVPRRVSFRHRPHGDPSEHQQFFGCPTAFGADGNELLLDPQNLDLPIAGSDELAHRHFLQGVEAVLGTETNLKPTSEAVRQYVVKHLQHGPPRRDEVARSMGKTSRTLLRYLEREGQTFEMILDSSRHELALAYAADRRLASFEIAGLLGYTEPSAFFRAFRRWTGESPQQHRRHLPASLL